MFTIGGLGTMLAFGAFLSALLFLLGVFLYLLMAFGLYTLAVRQNVEYSWLAFIPIAQLYILGKLIKELKIHTYVVPRHEWVLVAAPLAYFIFTKVPLLGTLLWLAMVVLEVAALYYLFKRYHGEKAIWMTVVSVVLFFMGPVFIFMMRELAPLDEQMGKT